MVKFPCAHIAYDPAFERQFGQQQKANAVAFLRWEAIHSPQSARWVFRVCVFMEYFFNNSSICSLVQVGANNLHFIVFTYASDFGEDRSGFGIYGQAYDESEGTLP